MIIEEVYQSQILWIYRRRQVFREHARGRQEDCDVNTKSLIDMTINLICTCVATFIHRNRNVV